MKDQCQKFFLISLIAIAVETLTALNPLLAQQIPGNTVEETVISVEDVKPLETPTGVPQDLEKINEFNSNQWNWGVGGENQNTSANSQADSVYQIDNKSKPNTPVADWQQDSHNWQSGNRGDYTSTSSKIPFARF